MPDLSNESKYEYLFKLELRGKSIPDTTQAKIAVLEKRRRKVSFLMLANVLFVIVFYASYEFGITSLNPTWIVGLAVVFFINVLLQSYQIKNIKEAISFYTSVQNN